MNQHGETNNNQWKKFSMMYSRFRGTRKYCSATKVSNNQNYLCSVKLNEFYQMDRNIWFKIEVCKAKLF